MGVSAFVVLAIGGFLLVYGPAAFRAALFPLLFLAFMIPIPGAVLDGTVWLLRTGSTHAVSGLFELTGTPYYREGFVFSLPSVVIEIAEECSGIRSSIALVLTALLAGDLYLDRGWKKAVLVMATLPLTILKNGIRIATLTLLSIHVDPSFLTGQLHHDGGIVFFLMTLALLAPVLAWLRPAPTPRVRPA
jgi:exosortase